MNELTGGTRQLASSPASLRANVALKLVIAIGLVNFASAGCRSRVDHANTAATQASPSAAANPASSIVESKTLANRDTQFDLPFAEEKTQIYKLSPGAVVKLGRINGRIEIQNSASDDAELYIVRSVEKPEHLRNRKLIIEHEPDELTIRMERERRSAMFSMFSERGSEKQRLILKLPHKVDLEIEGVSGRINVGVLDGDLSINEVYGKVAIAQVTGGTTVSEVRGSVRIVQEAKNRKDLKVNEVNGAIEVLFLGEVNAELRIENVRGKVDPDLPHLVYDGERRQNNFRARVGKGGPLVDISGVNGKVRLAAASKEDLLPATTASAKE
ncbi:MAG: DUF4097 family beta strand repeat-containing protein [Acidobacteriota bacterium]